MNSRDPRETNSHYDLIIIGAGAAGLSLVLALAKRQFSGKVLILERSEALEDNRTFSFWMNPNIPDYLQSEIDSQWSTWSVSEGDDEIRHTTSEYPYCTIKSATIHELALKTIEKLPNFTIRFSSTVERLEFESPTWKVESDSGKYTADNIVDTRPHKMSPPKQALHQCFFGIEVETHRPKGSIDRQRLPFSNQVYLMHELTPKSGVNQTDSGIEFIYILPYSANHALIEFTGFYTSPVDVETMRTKAFDYFDKLKAKHTTINTSNIKRTEHACLPMFNIHPSSIASNFAYGGIVGGAMRASTGYCFATIQKWAQQTAFQITVNMKVEQIDPIPKYLRIMDNIFLDVIRHSPTDGIRALQQMVKKNTAKRFARFMSEDVKAWDILLIIISMPKMPFIKSAIRLLLSRQLFTYGFRIEQPINSDRTT